LLASISAPEAQAAAHYMADYVSVPQFMSAGVKPRIMILLDNSVHMNGLAYWQEVDPTAAPSSVYNPFQNYYGNFAAGTPMLRAKYVYANGKFERDDINGKWDGNFLNWLCMRKVDIVRKVLIGGKASARSKPDDPHTLYVDGTASSEYSYRCRLDSATVSLYTNMDPTGDGLPRYVMRHGDILSWDTDSADVDPSKPNDADERRDVVIDVKAGEGDTLGVFYAVGDKAKWGLAYMNEKAKDGSRIDIKVGDMPHSTFATNVGNTAMDAKAQLAEGYYVVTQYFKQELPDAGLGNWAVGGAFNNDPFDVNEYCAKAFVLLFSAGVSKFDTAVPAAQKDYDGDTSDPYPDARYAEDGTDYLDDLALYARTNDLRPVDMEGDQNLELFVVYALGNDANARRLLKDTARNGGFIDLNGNDLPDPVIGTSVTTSDYTDTASFPAVGDDSWAEWWEDRRTDSSGNALPDTYFEGEDGYSLERELRRAITEILERAASGTAVSVLATSGEGEGTLYQAFFRPKTSTANEEISWTGYLQSMWVDSHGNLREDWTSATNPTPDRMLDLTVDPIVSFYFDGSTSETKFNRYLVSSTDPFGETATPTIQSLRDLSPLWEAGEQLASRNISALPRTIYTFVDIDGSDTVDGNGSLDSNEYISFTTANATKLRAYLDLPTSVADYDYLGADETDRVANLINYIQGSDTKPASTNLRNRTMDSKVWRLGDIIYSTPTPIGPPLDNYDLIYADQTYADYFVRHQNRETVIYVGANDGMLHAFLAGVFNPGTVKTGQLAGHGANFTVPAEYGSLNSGDEIWAYIPQNLLPHLKWLADATYEGGNHVYYVDLKPRIFDARIYEGASDGSHPLNGLWNSMDADQKADRPNGWCTVLVGGMRFGGGPITVTGDFDNDTTEEDRTFSSAYFAMDITDPLEPILLWERTYPGLGFTTSFPAVLKVDEKSVDTSTNPDTVNTDDTKWFLHFGSGPTWPSYDGISSQSGRLYLVDMATGNLQRTFTEFTEVDGTNPTSFPAAGFMGSPISVDMGLDYSVNVAYVGETHGNAVPYAGGLYRLKVKTEERTTPDLSTNYTYYYTDPANWVLSKMFEADYAVTAAPVASIGTEDSEYSLWIYFGTGRYLADSDKTDTNTQYLYGIKDPYFNEQLTDAERTTMLSSTLDKTSLYNATGVEVFTDGTTSTGLTFQQLKVMQEDPNYFQVGWYRELEISGERIVNKPSILGGILLAPSFVPNDDVCGFGGDSYLYTLYFETGTAYDRSVIGLTDDADAPAGEKKVLDKTSLGEGVASSMGIHIGREIGARGFIQQSTGTVTELDLQPAFAVKSGFMSWRER
jgi:type IV pilus assembly protein PilY1